MLQNAALLWLLNDVLVRNGTEVPARDMLFQTTFFFLFTRRPSKQHANAFHYLAGAQIHFDEVWGDTRSYVNGSG